MFKFLFILAIAILIIVLQIGFLPGLSYNLNLVINLPLLLIVLLTFFSDYELSITAALILGFLLDLYSYLFFGFFIIVFVSEVLIIRFFLLHILQTKKLVTLLVINLISIFIWQFIYIITTLITSRFGNPELISPLVGQYFIYSFYQLFIHSLIILLLYKFFIQLKSNLSPNLTS